MCSGSTLAIPASLPSTTTTGGHTSAPNNGFVRRQVGLCSKANWSLALPNARRTSGRAKDFGELSRAVHLGLGGQDAAKGSLPNAGRKCSRERAPFVVATNFCRGQSVGVRCDAFNDVPTIWNGGCRGMHKVTIVPSPTSLRTSSRNEAPNKVCSRRRSNDSARRPGRFAKKTLSTSFDATPCPSSLTLMFSHSPAARIDRRSRPALAEDCSPCCTAFSTSG